MRLNKPQTKPCKYATKCKYLPKDKCWFSHATVAMVESAYQQNGNTYESMKFQNQCMGELAQFAPEIDKIESDKKSEIATNSQVKDTTNYRIEKHEDCTKSKIIDQLEQPVDKNENFSGDESKYDHLSIKPDKQNYQE